MLVAMQSEHLYREWLQRADLWIAEFMDESGLTDPRTGVQCLKVTLHALRDRLSIDDCAGLAGRLPTLLRGFFFEGWSPAARRDDADGEYLQRIRRELPSGLADEPERYAQALMHVLTNYVGGREATRLRRLLPAQV
jgi:uncharacterized protein (DUF2267 family)